MSNSAALLKYLTDHPYQANTQLSAALGLSMGSVSSLTTQMYKAGQLDRKEGEAEGNRVPPFLYFVPEKPAGKRELAQRAKPRKKKEVAGKPVEAVTPAPRANIAKPKLRAPLAPAAPLVPRAADNHPMQAEAVYAAHMAQVQTAMAGSLDTLVRGLAQQIALGVQVALVEELAKLSTMTAVSSPLLHGAIKEFNKPQEQKEVKPKVVIAGLLPNQAGIISAEYGEVFNLDFYMVGESLQQFRDKLTNADYAITFVRKISHKVEDVVKERGLTPIRFSGGINRLKDLLLELYTNGRVEA